MSISNSHNHALPPRYSIPKHPGDLHQLGQLFGSAYSAECADIVKHHKGLVMLVATDMESAMKLSYELHQFTNQKIITLSDWETLPYDEFSPHQEIISNRLSSLYHLPHMTRGIIILPINTLMQRVCPRSFLHSYTLIMRKSQQLSHDQLRYQLEQAGYRSVAQVMKHGEFASRGELVDLYPMGSKQPYRIYLRDDKIDSIRIFAVSSQRTLREVETINLLPSHEFPRHKQAIELFRSQWREQLSIHRNPKHIYHQVSKGSWPAGIEYWQALFFKQPLSSIFSYLPANTLILSISNLEKVATHFWNDINQRYQNQRSHPMRPPLAPDSLWLSIDTLFLKLKNWPRIVLDSTHLPSQEHNTNLGYYTLPDLAIQPQNKITMEKLQHFIVKFNGSIIFSVASEGRRKPLQALLAIIKISASLIDNLDQAETGGHYMMIGAAECGFFDSIRNRVLICESNLLGKRVNLYRQENQLAINTDKIINNLGELNPGQPIVHITHGIGRYVGLTTLETGGMQSEYLIVSYADEDKLYVPVSSLHLISRYMCGTNANAPLHKLGSDAWARARNKAKTRVRDIAAELLEIYAQRAAKTGFSFKHNSEQYRLFCQNFPFETTPDQQQAINAVLKDMCQPLAMDRLVCGDVGFGKTEVAMRAAFLAVKNGKQVAILVPTTLLAQQHFDNFRDRFSTWKIRIEMMSRFRSVKEHKHLLEDTATGQVDIIIGTHKLLQSNLKWKDLGLLIVDEEHRFGVRHKERIKAMRADLDILTLTATPIPRTLNMAMNGMRDLSVISTPPTGRLAVKTFVREYDHLMVREAILREISRGGQVYYLYNDVDSIDSIAKKLQKLVPEARIAIGHGQMRESDLERVMSDFIYQRFNVLVCTTIIETGIDIANANTIIIERADRFGLAQLHQLRGRVGRSHHQAYSYMLTPSPKVMSPDTQKKLLAISSVENLGAGFELAVHDLEIRGAGELLGEDQSGQMASVGFYLYMEFLEKAVDDLKNNRELSRDTLITHHTEVDLRMPTLLPEYFLPDVNTRLSFYKRIADAKTVNELQELKMELVDRFGALPEPAYNLLQNAALRQQAQALGIKRIDGNDTGGFIEFSDDHCIDLDHLRVLIENNPQVYRLNKPRKLQFKLDLINRQTRMKFIDNLLRGFASYKVTPVN